MNWFAFFGAFAGVVFAIATLFGIFFVWDHFDRQKSNSKKDANILSIDDILESHLEEFIVKNFSKIFLGWKIYSSVLDEENSKNDNKLTGVRYRTKAGEIDLLCIDDDNNFVVIELKRNKVSDKVVAQVDRYIAWVEENLTKEDQTVRGIVIAKSYNEHLFYSLSRREDISLLCYDWQLNLNHSI